MPFNEQIADRVREMLADSGLPVDEKKMFGGLCFMVDGKMCMGVREHDIMVRLDHALADKLAAEKDGCQIMYMKERVMKGYLNVQHDHLRTNKELSYWVKLALEFNPLAQSSKKK